MSEEILNEAAHWLSYCFIEGDRTKSFHHYLNEQIEGLADTFGFTEEEIEDFFSQKGNVNQLRAKTMNEVYNWVTGGGYITADEIQDYKEICFKVYENDPEKAEKQFRYFAQDIVLHPNYLDTEE
jgi:hypothetical protein